MIQLCEEAYNVAKSIDAGGKHLILCNFTGIKSTKQFLEESRNFGLRTAGIAEKIAIVGVVGARRFLVESYMLFTGQWDMKNFNTEKEALAWLIA